MPGIWSDPNHPNDPGTSGSPTALAPVLEALLRP